MSRSNIAWFLVFFYYYLIINCTPPVTIVAPPSSNLASSLSSVFINEVLFTFDGTTPSVIVEIWNNSGDLVEVSDWSLCSGAGVNCFNIVTAAVKTNINVGIISGKDDFMSEPGENFATVRLPDTFSHINPQRGSLFLYKNTSFDSPDSLISVVSWGHSRNSLDLAKKAGVWKSSSNIDTTHSLQFYKTNHIHPSAWRLTRAHHLGLGPSNLGLIAPSEGRLFITEIGFPNEGNIFIEIYNPGSEDASVQNQFFTYRMLSKISLRLLPIISNKSSTSLNGVTNIPSKTTVVYGYPTTFSSNSSWGDLSYKDRNTGKFIGYLKWGNFVGINDTVEAAEAGVWINSNPETTIEYKLSIFAIDSSSNRTLPVGWSLGDGSTIGKDNEGRASELPSGID